MSVFDHIESVVVPKSNFNLSHNNLTTMRMGFLYPTLALECYPGDFFNIVTKHVVRLQPMLAPIMHQINITHHFFFVPYRILDKNWENFITGGPKGNDNYELPTFKPVAGDNGLNTLWDYLGFPLRQDNSFPDVSGVEPMAYPFLAYHRIWNDWYRDEDLQDDIQEILDDIENVQNQAWFNTIRPRAWEKDYFTIARPSAQKGTAPAINVSLTGTLGYSLGGIPVNTTNGLQSRLPVEASIIQPYDVWLGGSSSGTGTVTEEWIKLNSNNTLSVQNPGSAVQYGSNGVALGVNMERLSSSLNLNNVTAQFDVSQLRLAVQMQKWLERNMRAGNRYIEFLLAHFGIAPNDARLQRPEYIGGTKAPIISSEVLQTSATVEGQTRLGTMAGHGISADKTQATKYAVKENGVIMCITSVLPRTIYSQGVNRQWLRRSRYDFYSPEFAHLSEQMVLSGELYADGTEIQNTSEFGFQGRFNELRYIPNRFGAQMRNTFAYYHLGRWFNDRPQLNESFVTANQVSTNPFGVTDEDTMICNIGFEIMATRSMPYYPTPGMLDHF